MRPLTTEDRFAQPDPIVTEISRIDQGGTVFITFDPAEVYVPDDWQKIFQVEERAKLEEKTQAVYKELASQFLAATFFKESDELD